MGAPYIYDISRLRVKVQFREICRVKNSTIYVTKQYQNLGTEELLGITHRQTRYWKALQLTTTGM
jgi:hypothetical protein